MTTVVKHDPAAVEFETMDEDQFDFDAYSKVSRAAQLHEVSLVSTNYDVKMNRFWSSAQSSSKMNSSFHGEFKGCHFDGEMGSVAGGYTWTVDIKSGRYKALKLKCDYVLVYGNLAEQDSSYVQFYFQKIARFTSYPYFRSIFATLTSSSGLALEPLPSLTDRVD